MKKQLLKDFIKEFFEFLRERKKYWLFHQKIIVLALFGILIVLSQGSAVIMIYLQRFFKRLVF